MAKLSFLTAELFVTGGFRDPNFRKKKVFTLQFHKIMTAFG